MKLRPMPTMEWRRSAVCQAEDPELFFSEGDSAHARGQTEEARAICRRCPVMAQCLAWALETRQRYGVWGGLSTTERDAMRRRNRKSSTGALAPRTRTQNALAPCGTEAAYRRHIRAGEQPCAACRAANARSKAEKTKGRRPEQTAETSPPVQRDQCGTPAGYDRHRRRGEQPCRACKDANAVASKHRRAMTVPKAGVA